MLTFMVSEHPEFAKFLAYSFLLLSDLIAYCYTLLKVFRILCFSKITLDQLPLVNPYKWPLSFFRLVTQPYFKVWQKLLPTLKLGTGSYDISVIMGLEAISCFISLSVSLRAATFTHAQNILATLN